MATSFVMRLAGYVALIVLSLGVAGYAVGVYGFLPMGAVLHPDMRATFEAHRTAVYVHIFASAVALALGPLQFSTRLRTTRLGLHRWLGRLYLGVGVLGGGLAGLSMALHAFWGSCLPAGLRVSGAGVAVHRVSRLSRDPWRQRCGPSPLDGSQLRTHFRSRHPPDSAAGIGRVGSRIRACVPGHRVAVLAAQPAGGRARSQTDRRPSLHGRQPASQRLPLRPCSRYGHHASGPATRACPSLRRGPSGTGSSSFHSLGHRSLECASQLGRRDAHPCHGPTGSARRAGASGLVVALAATGAAAAFCTPARRTDSQ